MDQDQGSGRRPPPTVWRDPAEETDGLYPGLCVNDGRVSGSITVGRSRLPLWVVAPAAVLLGWDAADAAYDISELGFGREETAEFLGHLIDGARGDAGRLLLALADAERVASERDDRALAAADDGSGIVRVDLGDGQGVNLPGPWWRHDDLRGRVVAALRRLLADLDPDAAEDPPAADGRVG